VIQLRRIRSWLAVVLAVATVCAVAATVPAAASPASAAVTAAGPASVPAGPGCPAGMLAWLPDTTALTSGNPQAVAPGSLSPEAQASFGAQVLRLLAGQQVSWLGSTGCTQVPSLSGASQAAAPRGAVTPRASQPVALTTPANHFPPNWSGFESDASNFTGASMTWSVPIPVPTASPASLSIWPGIGQGTSPTKDLLIQAGTAQSQGGGTYAWTEVFPLELELQINGMSVAPGDNMAVNVAWDHSAGIAAFLVVNYSTHKAKEVTQGVTGSSGSTAEWIVERSEFCGGKNCTPGIFPHLLNFGQLEIVNGAAEQTVSGSTVTKYISGFASLVNDTMQACPNLATPPNLATLATASHLDTQGDFLDTFVHPGTFVDPGHCEWTISPQNATYHGELAPNSTAALYDKAAALNIICQQAPLSGTTNPSGSYPAVATITASSFTACADTDGGVWSAHQTSGSAWSLDGDSASLDGVMTGDISSITASMSGDISGKTCAFMLTGSVTEGDATYINPNKLRITGASLAVSGVSGAGCATVGVDNGDTFTLTADYTVTSPTGGIVLQPGP
jgi:hypothetical protein